MESWVAAVIVLFSLGLAFPLAGALLAFRRARRNLSKSWKNGTRFFELEAEWKAKRAARPQSAAEAGLSEAAFQISNETFDLERIIAFADEGMLAPTDANLPYLPSIEASLVLRKVLDGNVRNLVLILIGPVLSTAASIIAIFPAWHLPA